MKISVVIPVYNGEKYVGQCLDNMMRQTYKDLEIIVVNDGSTDRTAEITEKYPAVKLITQPNGGPSVARNTGIDAASGDYIHFMDVDDVINDEFYERMAEAVVATDADMACCGMINEPRPHRTTLWTERLVLTEVGEKFAVTNVGVWSWVWRYLFRTSFLRSRKEFRFEPGRIIEDMPFAIAAVYFANKVVLVPGAVYTYVRPAGSLMAVRDRARRRKRHQDHRHAKTLRHKFARKHGFKIPGVPTALGPISLFYVKWFT
jgi:glycosyltransferase involved in cell wall biosynthesis